MQHKHKNHLRPSIALAAFISVTLLILSVCFTACNSIVENVANTKTLRQQTLLLFVHDKSLSTTTFPAIDTVFLRKLCYVINKDGGTLVYYPVGNPTDGSGLRCTLIPMPEVNERIMMEKQVEQKQEQDKIIKRNAQEIEHWLSEVQRKFLGDTVRQLNTDLNGVFTKADILMNEPQYLRHKRFLFVVSDGVQSINRKDSPARFNFRDTTFTLCVCGWKTELPDTMDVLPFEAPQGFIEYFNNFLTVKN